MRNSDDSMTVSVILPVRLREADINELPLLERAFSSIFSQEFPDEFEVLVIDDGSSLPLEHAIKNIRCARPDIVNIVRCEPHGGLVHALNVGLSRARFRYIARLDADDAWLEGKISK